MDKLKVIIVKEATVTMGMAGCGKNNPNLCGARECVPGLAKD